MSLLLLGAGAGKSPEFTPSDISGGFHLSSDYGVSKSVSTLTAWAHRGSLNPGFIVKGTGLTVDANGDIDFPSNAAVFLYEGTPVADVENHTIFGIFRRDVINSAESIAGKYWNTINHRTWSLQQNTTTTFYVDSANGTSGATTTTGPAFIGWGNFLIRKNGTTLRSYFNGIDNGNTAASATLFDSVHPICIGGWGGDASTDLAAKFDGAFRDFGYFNTAVSDANMALILDYMAGRM